MRIFLSVAAALLASSAAHGEPVAVSLLASGTPLHGVNGIRFAPDGELYAGSVIGETLYAVDVTSSAVRTVVGPPWGMADDIAFGPNGEVVWTALLKGVVHIKRGDGPVQTLVRDMPGANSVVWTRDGRHLYLGQVSGGGDAVWELDPGGIRPARRIIGQIGGFNSFDAGPDGGLYGPLSYKGKVVRIDPATGEVSVVADGFKLPVAAKFGPDGALYVIDSREGALYRIDANGGKAMVAQLRPSLDNMEFSRDGRLFVSNSAESGIQELDFKTGRVRDVVPAGLASPYDIALSTEGGRDFLYVADGGSLRRIDGVTGKVETIALSAKGEIGWTRGIAVASGRILAVGVDGRIDTREIGSGRRLAVTEPFTGTVDAVGLSGGDIVTSRMDGTLTRLSGAASTVIARGLVTPVSLAAGRGNKVYVAERDAGRISRVDPGTGKTRVIATGFVAPQAIAATPDGKLAVLDTGAKQVLLLDPATGHRRVLAADLPFGYLPGAPYGGIAAGAGGAIYVSCDGNNAIYRITGDFRRVKSRRSHPPARRTTPRR